MRRQGAVAAVVALAMAVALHAETSFFSSDAAAWPLARIPDPTLDTVSPVPEFYLRVEKNGGAETRTLFKQGKESERRVLGPAAPPAAFQEDLFRQGRLAERTSFGKRREMLEELVYDSSVESGPLVHRTVYSYKATRLALVERFNPEGASLGTKRYRYDPRGRLLEIELSGDFGLAKEGEVPGSPLPRLTWSELKDSGVLRIERFDEAGRVVLVRTMAEGKELEVTRFAYDDEGRLKTETSFVVASGLGRLSSYDGEGRLQSLVSKKGRVILERWEYEWDEGGSLTAERRLFPAPVELHSYMHDEAGLLVREEFWTTGKLDRAIVHESEGKKVEELYFGGYLVIRAYFEAGFKVREEFLEGGVVIRERRYR